MLKKKFSLPKEKLFVQKRIETPFCAVKIADNGLELSRFGFVIPKKVDKRATVRNRIKRILRAKVEENLNNFKPGFDFLFIIKNKIEKKEAIFILDKIKSEGFI